MSREQRGQPVVPQPSPSRRAGAEPIAGYRLIEPLGRGGFGEVWKCEAPGGLFKAIKFVSNNDFDCAATQELEALQWVKYIRHPFILSLERVEVVDGLLLIIMELADHNLHTLHQFHREQGLEGIPRDELLGFLYEAAEALDYMNFEHGLQHLDIKPHNLFIISHHLKVADFGLVQSLGDVEDDQHRMAAGSPLYAPPELLRGGFSRTTDQYSLAVVYQQMLTGTVPFWHENLAELATLQLSTPPKLSTLPATDQPVVATALSKNPKERFPSCLEFIHALVKAQPRNESIRRSGQSRKITLQVPPAQAHSLAVDQPTRLVGAEIVSAAVPSPEKTRVTRPKPLSDPLVPLGSAPTEVPPPVTTPGLVPPAPPVRESTPYFLPGYQLVSCLNPGPLGDVWRVVDPQGREKRALCLASPLPDPRAIEKLRGLEHPDLVPREVVELGGDRVALVTDISERTLRDRLEECQKAGVPGIPREELLGYVRSVASTLDALGRQHHVPHLGLNPRNVVLDDDRTLLADHGLIFLLGLSGSNLAGHARYAAPEVLDGSPCPTSDQFSLALLYAEMLTGIYPRPLRLPGSGLHRRPSLQGPRPASPSRPLKFDLDLLPQPDRDAVAQALSVDPEKRFPSCPDFVRALEATPAPVRAEDLYRALPLVIPFASLMGDPPSPDLVLPLVPPLIKSLTSHVDPRFVEGVRNTRYLVHPNGDWEYKCPIQVLAYAIDLKVDGFRQHWNAQLREKHTDWYRFHLELPPPRRFWERTFGIPRRLEIDLEIEPRGTSPSRLTQACMRIRAHSGDPVQMARVVEEMAPQLFDSFRSFLQASPEQRREERRPYTDPVHVYPVFPGLDLGEVIEGTGKDLATGGIGFRVAQVPPVEQFYLHFPTADWVRDFALLARLVRIRPAEGGGHEVAAVFPGQHRPVPVPS